MHIRARVLTAILMLSVLSACGGEQAPAVRVRLATTTSTDNSGLLADILPPFEKESGIAVDVIAVGTGQALALAERGDADLLLVHARAREDAFVAAGHGIDRRDIMWNDFVIVGPPGDPAGAKTAADAVEALHRVAAVGATFVSRGDDSGTHIREQALWEAAGGRPEWDGYLDAGQGMGACLTIAHERQGYVLTDRGTYLAFSDRVDLGVVHEGDERLRNPYGAMLVNPAHHPHVRADAARRLLDYLTSVEGQQRIGAFRVNGKVLFHPVSGP